MQILPVQNTILPARGSLFCEPSEALPSPLNAYPVIRSPNIPVEGAHAEAPFRGLRRAIFFRVGERQRRQRRGAESDAQGGAASGTWTPTRGPSKDAEEVPRSATRRRPRRGASCPRRRRSREAAGPFLSVFCLGREARVRAFWRLPSFPSSRCEKRLCPANRRKLLSAVPLLCCRVARAGKGPLDGGLLSRPPPAPHTPRPRAHIWTPIYDLVAGGWSGGGGGVGLRSQGGPRHVPGPAAEPAHIGGGQGPGPVRSLSRIAS